MKKTIVLLSALAFAATAQAQSLDEGVKMYKYERYQSAEKALTPLAAGNAMANYYLGLSQLAENKVNDAKATFAKYPDDPANMSGNARIAFMEKNVMQGNQLAANVAAKAKKKDWQPLKYAADAITYTDGGNTQQAIDWYKAALQNTDDADVHIDLGDAYQKTAGGGGEAMNNYEHVTEKDTTNSLAFSRIGALWYAAHNYQSALDNYSRAKNADPSNPLPYRDLANAYFWVGKYDLALQNIQQYMNLSDKTTADKIQYLDILYLSKNYKDAAAQAQDLINSGEKNPDIYGILGFSQNELKDSVNALNNARIFFQQKDPSKIRPLDYVSYAQIWMSNSKADSANYYFSKAIAADTAQDKSDLYRQIAENFKDSKNYAMSAQWYNKLITENPSTQALDYFWAGVMYFYAQDYTNAATVFEKFETKYPDQPSATYWRGRVAAAQDPEAKSGAAVPFFTKWITAVGPTYDKKNDLKLAYEYLLLYYYNKNDKANEQTYKEKITAIDPADNMVKQIEAAEKSGGAKKK